MVECLDMSHRLETLSIDRSWSIDESGRYFTSGSSERPDAIFRPSMLQPIPEGVTTIEQYADAVDDLPGSWVLVLMQAGAASIGYWEDDELLAHKVFKRYVVRGKGKAQGSYLKTKGKSRYGSRLRLQNARSLLIDVNERLHEWWNEFGEPDRVLASCPVRTWPELWSVKPPPPFARDDVDRGIPLDVAVPSFDELKRVGRFALNARIETF